MLYQRRKVRGGGVESYLYPVKEGQRYINLNHGRFFVQQPPKRERDHEAHLNYYASFYDGRDNYHTARQKTKSNTTKTSIYP